jgi:hypothetical protein
VRNLRPEGGTNVGPEFSESAGYGEHLVELSGSLQVVAASHPAATVQGTDDVDFIGWPVPFTRLGAPRSWRR